MPLRRIGLLPDAVELGFHCVRTQWIRGFMTFRLARRAQTVMLMVSACPESGFLGHAARAPPIISSTGIELELHYAAFMTL